MTRLVPAAIAAVALSLGSGCESTGPATDKPVATVEPSAADDVDDGIVALSAETIRRIGLEIVSTDQREIPVEIDVSGRVMLNDDRTVQVSSFIGGIVTECCGSVGDIVGERHVLAVVHSHQTHDLLSEYRQAAAEFHASVSQLELAREAHQRETRLLELKVGSVAAVQTARGALVRAERDVHAADAGVEATIAHLDYLVEEIPQEIHDREIAGIPDFDIAVRTPLAGTIITRTVTPGDVVAPTDELFRISDLRRLWVIAQVPEEHLSQVEVGMDAAVTVRAYPDRVFAGQVTRIGTELDPDTQTVQVRCEVDNPEAALKTGMYAAITLRSRMSRPALVVPADAVQWLEEDAFVFRPVDQGRFQRHAITTGSTVDGGVEVLDGLSVRDPVVGHGSFLLKAEMLKGDMTEG